MVRFEDVSNGSFERVSFRIGPGMLCKIIARSEPDKNALLETMLSLGRLDGGRVLLMGRDIYALGTKELLPVFGRMGVVLKEGRVISNLRVWENITLPACYHNGAGPSELEAKVEGFYLAMGFQKGRIGSYLGKSPELLPARERRLMGVIRAMLAEPDLIIYDSPFEDMDAETAGRLDEVITRFHRAGKGRATVFAGSHEEALGPARADMVLKQQGKGFAS